MIQASGQISAVDFMFLVNSVIQGLVLLNVAVVVTQMVAYYALGDRSKMYKEFGNETAIFEREGTDGPFPTQIPPTVSAPFVTIDCALLVTLTITGNPYQYC